MTTIAEDTTVAATEGRITCAICGGAVHSIALHLTREHADLGMSLADYEAKYPGRPVLSEMARKKIEEYQRASAAKAAAAPASSVTADFHTGECVASTKALHEAFGLPAVAATMSARGKPVPISVFSYPEGPNGMVPDLDPNYVFNVDILKTLLMGMEMRIPVYLWGHSGTGKTTIYEQIAARTGRQLLRVQHTVNMEEEHVVGGWRLRDGHTIFELGPLPMAMKNGWLYLADEYDFARPEVLSLYQAVLEGKPLMIKEADPDNRIIRPHPNFRIVATGNTNGQGDETGLYSGTSLQNAANFERFGIVEKMPYMDAKLEAQLVSGQGGITLEDAKKLVDFAARIREQFESAKLSNPISPRSLIYAAKLGMAKGNFLFGLEKAYLNRLTAVDRESASQLASRIFTK